MVLRGRFAAPAGYREGIVRSRAAGRPESTNRAHRYGEGNAARPSQQSAVLDASQFGDFVDEPDAGEGKPDAECQREHIDDHPVAIVLLLSRALELIQICNGGRVARRRFAPEA